MPERGSAGRSQAANAVGLESLEYLPRILDGVITQTDLDLILGGKVARLFDLP